MLTTICMYRLLSNVYQARRAYNAFKYIAADEPAAGVSSARGIGYLEDPSPEYFDQEMIGAAYSHLDGFYSLSRDEHLILYFVNAARILQSPEREPFIL